MRAEPRTIHITVPGVQRLRQREVELSICHYGAFFDDITDIFFQAASGAFRTALLSGALRVDRVMKRSAFGHVCYELLSNEFRSLVGHD